jgi:hypothetical protein
MFTLAETPAGPVVGPDHPELADNRYGFEGGAVVKTAGEYHLFTAEMAGDPFWSRMRLAHWSSPDAVSWRRVGTLYETDGSMRPDDTRFSLWAPMAIFNDTEDRWNLFYIAYRPGVLEHEQIHMDGRVWRAVSATPGREGIGGPYRDAGIVLQPDADSQPWEGQQGTDSFYPWRADDRWLAFYGSHNHHPLGPWQVGLAEAPTLAGPWRRCDGLNPSTIEPIFIENPVVTRLPEGWVAVYDNCGPGDTYVPEARHVGVAFSRDGRHWPPGRPLAVQVPAGPAQWSEDCRTALGLIPEDDGTFTLLYTAKLRDQSFWGLGLARLRRG